MKNSNFGKNTNEKSCLNENILVHSTPLRPWGNFLNSFTDYTISEVEFLSEKDSIVSQDKCY